MIVVSTLTDPMQKWRAEGSQFAVQEFRVSSTGAVRFRIEAPDDAPALVDGASLSIIDGTIPSSWTILQRADPQSYVLGPRQWQEPGFWELWMDKDAEAQAAYEEFRSVLED